MVDGATERTGELVVAGHDGVVEEVLDATDCVVTPGLVNAHHHLLQSAFRTLPGTRGVAMRDWLPAMAAAYRRVGHDPELYALAASVGVAEGLLCGVTTIADHHLNWPHGAPVADTVALARATVGAARALGGRLVFVRGSALDDPAWAAASADAVVTALVPDPRAEGPGGVSADGMLQVAVGPAGAHSDRRETFLALGEVARRHRLRRRTQANEQVDTAIALEKYGRRPLDLLEEWGWLEPDVTIAHLCDVTDEEIGRLAAAGVTATHAPGCDVPMGWGVAPVARLLEAGVRVGLGTSGGGSNDAGHLRPGTAGDLCVWDVSGVADAGVADPLAGLLWASPGRRPRHVVVGGRVVVRDYRLVTADEAELVARLRDRLRRTPPV